MGSMKDLLGDDPPTIGDSRRLGMTTLSEAGVELRLATCEAACA